MKDLSKMTLKELRELYPTIKATSKEKFIEKVNSKVDVEIKLDTTTLQRIERIKEHFPEYLAHEMGKETGCDCVVERYEWFMYVSFEWSAEVDSAIIKATFDAFGERVKVTSCVGCLAQRRSRLRTYYEKLIK